MRYLSIILSLFSVLSVCASVRGNLEELDRVVSQRALYDSSKHKEIDKLKKTYASVTTDSDRYNVLRALYKEYRTFRIDSAIIVADERLAIARRMGMPSKVASATLNMAESYVKSGLADKALAMLDTLDRSRLEDYHRKYLNSVYKSAYKLKAQTEMLPADRKYAVDKVRELRDLALRESTPDSRAYYTVQAEKYMDAGLLAEAVRKIEEADSLFDFSDDAAMQYTMGEIYLAAGKREEAIRSLSRAAVLDLSSATKEYQSLILLASLLFEEGDVERAFVYINCALEDTHFSNANLRNPAIMENMPVIDKAFHAYEEENKRLTHIFLWTGGVMLTLLLVSLVLLLGVLRKNRRMLATIAEINDELKLRNAQLENADKLKLKNINTLILSNARYISRLKDYRKTIYRLMKTGQYDKALEALKSDRTNSREVSAFHEMFDEAFLSMFPDFIERVNALIREPIELKEGNRLTPELRVIALMRLGLSSTEEIAGILHYSSQSVYNLRSTIRSMSKIPRDDFEEAISRL